MIKAPPPEIVFVTSFPPRECGIATYSQDLIKALKNKFGDSFLMSVCALESKKGAHNYGNDVSYLLDTSDPSSFAVTADQLNQNTQIKLVLIQHEFGFFSALENDFLQFISALNKPVVVVFHTVLPSPNAQFKANVQEIAKASHALIVMTNHASHLLTTEYQIPASKISMIAHGTHLVQHLDKDTLKQKYGLSGKKVLTTFGLLSSGKSIETTLKALPEIITAVPDVVFLAIGKTHPEVLRNEGESYRTMLTEMVGDLAISNHVRFVNNYLALPELLEYLQLTDIYLFTTNDPNQAVSGTFVYAMSCGCPIISTPIPHARELLTNNTGIIVGFQDSKKLSQSVILLLSNEQLRKSISINTLQKIVSTAWENAAVEHAKLFSEILNGQLTLTYSWPEIKTDHLRKMTTNFGLLQFCKINQPDADSGYTIDDNARALVSMIMHFELTKDASDLPYIHTYLTFMEFCMQPSGSFLNYVDFDKDFTIQNEVVNLEDSNGRAMWALGFLVSKKSILPEEIVASAILLVKQFLPTVVKIHSARAMSFIIKGLYYYNQTTETPINNKLVELLANRLIKMYIHESTTSWKWFENYLTYANSILPEAILCASIVTGNELYKSIARESMDFLLSTIFNDNGIEVISNKGSYKRGGVALKYGEQPIDVAYTILALAKFYEVFEDKEYLNKLLISFEWFLGRNRLNQIVYNPCTTGCYDGMEEYNVNLNQGAESIVSYLMARIVLDNYRAV